jgi:hypothetical protein
MAESTTLRSQGDVVAGNPVKSRYVIPRGLFAGCGEAKLQVFQAVLADLNDAGHFHDRGFRLPLCKTSGLSMNCVSASKPIPVFVKQSHLPVMVFSPLVFSVRRGLPNFHVRNTITLKSLST